MTDAFPNYMSGVLALSGANSFTTTARELPVNRFGRVSGTQAMVMEMLWVIFETRGHDWAADGDTALWSVSIGSVPTAVGNYDNPDVIAKVREEAHLVTAVGHITFEDVVTVNLQTEDGHGVLVAADRIHISGISVGHAAALTLTWRIYYRWVKIPALEMMGILTSLTA